MRKPAWFMSLIERVWQRKVRRKMKSGATYLRATMNSPCPPYKEPSSGFFTLYVLLMIAARPVLSRTEAVAINVDAIIAFLMVCTTNMYFLPFSCSNEKLDQKP